MKAAVISHVGPPEAIQIVDLPDPVAGPGQVLVRVRAAAVNPIDTYVRSGSVAMPLVFPFVVGCDLAGEVVAVGSGVTAFKTGDRVWGSNQGVHPDSAICCNIGSNSAVAPPRRTVFLSITRFYRRENSLLANYLQTRSLRPNRIKFRPSSTQSLQSLHGHQVAGLPPQRPIGPAAGLKKNGRTPHSSPQTRPCPAKIRSS